MRTSILSLVLPASLVAQTPLAPPPNIDPYVADVLRTFEVPGVAVTIVKDGQVVLARGYGVKRLGSRDPVDANTLFGIASNTKVFTATALGLLAEEGKIEWDKPVMDYLPWFRLSDPYVTAQLTVRDLLVHRSGLGLGAGDLLWWPPSTYNRKEIARRLRYIPLATSFRSAYAYDNVLYLIAGEVVEAASGTTWEDFVQKRILTRIGMSNAQPSLPEPEKAGNVAATHAPVDGIVRSIRPFVSENTNPAGGIMAGAADLAKWLIVQLDSGRIQGGGRLFSAATARQLWTGVMPIPIATVAPELSPFQATFAAYGLGLNVRDYRGRKVLMHTGGLPGYVSRVLMFPDVKLGIAVMTNQESGAAFDAIALHIADYYLGAPVHNWLAAFRTVQARMDSLSRATERQTAAARDSLSKPSLPLRNYAGTYQDPWYGDVVVEESGGALVIRFSRTPSLVGDLRHWQHDSFLARWHDRELRADAFVTFWLNADGTIAEMRMVPASPAVDFSFDFQDLRLKRVRAAR